MTDKTRIPSSRAIFIVLAAALFLPTSARADKKEFMALTQQIATLQGQVAESEQARINAETAAQKEMRRLMDMLVEQGALLKRLQQDMRVLDERSVVAIKDQQERLSEIAERLRSGGSGIAPALVNTAGNGAVAGSQAPPIPPRDLYQQSYSDFARKNYELSVQGFLEYLRLYRDTDLADNAQYWVGECLQAQSKYEEAVAAFNALLRDFPDSDKQPDARYKKGVALEALGRRSQAVLEYRFVVERFPGAPAARLAREKLAQP